MYTVKKKYYDGYTILPCFKVKCFEYSDGCEVVTGKFLEFIFSVFFAPFWDGKVVLTGEHYE